MGWGMDSHYSSPKPTSPISCSVPILNFISHFLFMVMWEYCRHIFQKSAPWPFKLAGTS